MYRHKELCATGSLAVTMQIYGQHLTISWRCAGDRDDLAAEVVELMEEQGLPLDLFRHAMFIDTVKIPGMDKNAIVQQLHDSINSKLK